MGPFIRKWAPVVMVCICRKWVIFSLTKHTKTFFLVFICIGLIIFVHGISEDFFLFCSLIIWTPFLVLACKSGPSHCSVQYNFSNNGPLSKVEFRKLIVITLQHFHREEICPTSSLSKALFTATTFPTTIKSHHKYTSVSLPLQQSTLFE